MRSALERRPGKNSDTTSAPGRIAADAHPHKRAANAAQLRMLTRRVSKRDLFWPSSQLRKPPGPEGNHPACEHGAGLRRPAVSALLPSTGLGRGERRVRGQTGHTQVADGDLRETTDLDGPSAAA